MLKYACTHKDCREKGKNEIEWWRASMQHTHLTYNQQNIHSALWNGTDAAKIICTLSALNAGVKVEIISRSACMHMVDTGYAKTNVWREKLVEWWWRWKGWGERMTECNRKFWTVYRGNINYYKNMAMELKWWAVTTNSYMHSCQTFTFAWIDKNLLEIQFNKFENKKKSREPIEIRVIIQAVLHAKIDVLIPDNE